MSTVQSTPPLQARVFPPTGETTEIAEEFVEFFTEQGLTIPPLPRSCLFTLERVDAYTFASMSLVPPYHYGPAPLLVAEDEPQAEEQTTLLAPAPTDSPVAIEEADPPQAFGTCPGLFLCGLSGHGVQSWDFRYIFSASRLHFSVVLPLGNAYNDLEREKADLVTAFDCIEACLWSTQGGIYFAGYKNAELFWELNAEGIRFALITLNGEILVQGDTLETLLDFFQTCLDAAAGSVHNTGDWLAV